jgi:site-specific DNA-methyltransferase (adenine-specific)
MSEGKKEILLGDCLELMKDIPNGSIDMILCDLPYGTTNCKWDIIIPFEPLWVQYKRVIKYNGAIVLTASQPFTSALVMSNPDMFRCEWIWDKMKGSGSMLAKIMPLKSHENILVFSKERTKYYPILEQADKKNIRDREKNFSKPLSNEIYGELSGYTGTKEDSTRKPKTIISISSQANELHQGKRLHPTQKPVALFEYLIKTYTNEGDVVLDNCAGSGTTAIACLNTKRQFIVMEKEQKYYDIILKRVGDFNKNFEPQTLFGNEM